MGHSYCRILSVLHFFVWPKNVPLDGTVRHLFIHSLAGGRLGCFYFLAVMNNAAVNIPVQVFV